MSRLPARPPSVSDSHKHQVGKESTHAARVLYVPENIVYETWRYLAPTAAAGSEGAVLWAVPAQLYQSQVQVATTVIAPSLLVSSGNYEIPRAAVRQMGSALRERGLVNVAQLHTHPGTWVGHSDWDDSHAYSLRDGALSIVWPNYGRGIPLFEHWGIHERREGEWMRLEPEEAAARIQMLPSALCLCDRIVWRPEDEDAGRERWDVPESAPTGIPSPHNARLIEERRRSDA